MRAPNELNRALKTFHINGMESVLNKLDYGSRIKIGDAVEIRVRDRSKPWKFNSKKPSTALPPSKWVPAIVVEILEITEEGRRIHLKVARRLNSGRLGAIQQGYFCPDSTSPYAFNVR